MKKTQDFAVLIPAYQPNHKLLNLIEQLSKKIDNIVVINDGSTLPASIEIIGQLNKKDGIKVLQHAVNMGKGAALKTGLNHIYLSLPNIKGVVTADADGQHTPNDILKVGDSLERNEGYLTLGTREFCKDVPLRSLIGNKLTRIIFRLLTGIKITDTQTGLRGIPRHLIPELLTIESNKYDYEMDMLLKMKVISVKLKELPIETIYEDNNRFSHFSPFYDSMKIYFVLFRFTASSLFAATVDLIIFSIAFILMNNLIVSQYIARTLSGILNFTINKGFVFKSDRKFLWRLIKYFLLVFANGFISYLMIITLGKYFSLPIVLSKAFAESILFVASFAIQRDFIFAIEK